MALFIVHHRHSAENCPARNKELAPMLLTHLAPSNAREYGVEIVSEAVIDGGHALYLTVEAGDTGSVKRFMEPFAQAGSVEILPASHCEAVIERGEC